MKDTQGANIRAGLDARAESLAAPVRPDAMAAGIGSRQRDPQLGWFAGFTGLLVLAYGWILVSLAVHAAGKEFHSHILLIPIVSGYLIYIDRNRLKGEFDPSRGWALALSMPALASLAVALSIGAGDGALSRNDFLALTVFSFLCFLAAGGFFFLGKRWMAAMAFPAAFLIFMVPLPDGAVAWIESVLMMASAEAADVLFSMSGVAYLRDGQLFQLPGIALEVAEECSGIRSSWVLFITSILASYVFLRAPGRRIFLVAVVIPLGILRNGFRVLVIGMLCVHIGPDMIDSIVHKKGGPRRMFRRECPRPGPVPARGSGL